MVKKTALIAFTSLNVSDSSNSTFTIQMPAGKSLDLAGAQIALSRITVPYEWFTFQAPTSFSIYYPNGTQTIKITVPIPGNCSLQVSDLNALTWGALYKAGAFLMQTATQTPQYFVQFSASLTGDAVQLDITPVPGTLPAGYASGGTMGGLSMPGTPKTPRVVFDDPTSTPASNGAPVLSLVFGFVQGQSYPATVQTTAYSVLSSKPKLELVNGLFICCDAVNEIFSVPSSCLATIPIRTSFLNPIDESPNHLIFHECSGVGQRDSLTVYINDQFGNRIQNNSADAIIEILIMYEDDTEERRRAIQRVLPQLDVSDDPPPAYEGGRLAKPRMRRA